MEKCPKCKQMVNLVELLSNVSDYDKRTHICTSCAIREGQSGRVEPHRYKQKSEVYFQRKRKR